MSSLNNIEKVEVIHIGDELLLGLRVNTHLEYLAQAFSKYGANLIKDQVVRDIRDEITAALSQAWGNSDMIILTGGLGPTVDDITRDSVAEFLGQKLVFNADVETSIRERFEAHGWEMTPNNLQQCYHPEGSEIIANSNGTAPGIWIEKADKLLVMLPGPPRELVPMVEESIIPRLLKEGRIELKNGYIQIRSCGVGESRLADQVDQLLQDEQKISVAYCVHDGVCDLRVASSDGNLDQAKRTADKIAEAIGEDFVGYGDTNTASELLSELAASQKTIAVAESCTGGLLASRFTEIPGASKAFKGGVVTYTNAIKSEVLGIPIKFIEEHHEVSEAVCKAMAEQVAQKMAADYAISTTGFAGPDGGTENDPVGTVYVGVFTPEGSFCKRFSISGERKTLIQRATTFALDSLRRKLLRSSASNH